MSVDKILARDRDLRMHATARPWHQEGQGTRFRLVGPLPRASVVVDPYVPNPQDGPLLLHRVNTYERLEEEIEQLRATLRDVRAKLDAAASASPDLPEEMLESLARDLRAGIAAALGDQRVVAEIAWARQAKAR
jgi:hypothetical protein